eukprot:TRINITY_DN1607_c0_g1_i16.p1 TRINITY_DN1607_c0_g1~~TRINITY_DN1607_c0_g1_i16.p1  ORF type:complete len:626 (-),score=124.61 TRINITY_DN1607_c0_g1_i16:12-1889(-)
MARVGACGTHLDLPRTLRETREKKKKKKKKKKKNVIFNVFFLFLPHPHPLSEMLRIWVTASLVLAQVHAKRSTVDRLKYEYVDCKIPELEHTRANSRAVLALAPHADCFFEVAPADAGSAPPRTVSAECALASIPRIERNGDFTANVSVAEGTHSLPDAGIFLPRAAKGVEITLFPTAPCGPTARFGGNSGGANTKADPIDGQCNVEAATPAVRGDWFASDAERFSIFAAPGDAIQDWRDTPAPTQEPQFPVYDEEWAVGCLGLSSELWECFSLVPSRRDRAGKGIETAPGWSSDRHAEVLIEKRLQRGEIDWDSEVPLCDVPVFDAAAEARAHPGRPLHELFSERYRRDGAQSPVLILNDPADAEFEAMDHGIRPDQIESDENSSALLFRGINFAGMKRGRLYNHLRMVNYRKDFLYETPAAQLAVMAFPPPPDPVCLRDPRKRPHVNLWTGEPANELFFCRNIYHFGGSGTSTTFHAHRASWLRLHGGTKVWFFYPPGARPVSRVMMRPGLSARYTSEGLVTSWLLRRDIPGRGGPVNPMLNFTYAQSVREDVPPKVCIQRAGTFMYVGDDWMHALVNVGLAAGTASFSQIAHTTEEAVSARPDAYFAEYPEPGHTVRSIPDS